MKPFTHTEEIERKTLLILKILNESREPIGARLIARRMGDHGVAMSERTVRYHLRLMDERRLTSLVGARDGRVITHLGSLELEDARVHDKIAFAISRIEMLAFRTTFNPKSKKGFLPVNVSILPQETFPDFLKIMDPAFQKDLCVSNLVAVGREGEKLGDLLIPNGKIGFATVCSVVINGVLLKSGIPVDSRFGGILQVQNGKPLRFSDLINYSGSSLNPSEAFVRARMTSVRDVIEKGEGKMLANFREIPVPCRDLMEQTLLDLSDAGIGGVMMIGEPGEPVCQIPVDMNRIGIVLKDGLNPVAYAQEWGVEATNFAMSAIIEYECLKKFQQIFDEYCSDGKQKIHIKQGQRKQLPKN